MGHEHSVGMTGRPALRTHLRTAPGHTGGRGAVAINLRRIRYLRCLVWLLLCTAVLRWGSGVAVAETLTKDQAAKLIYTTKASIAYHSHASAPEEAHKDITVIMAPVVDMVINAIRNNVAAAQMLPILSDAVKQARLFAEHLTPAQQLAYGRKLAIELASATLDRKAMVKLGLDFFEYQALAWDNIAALPEPQRTRVMSELQPGNDIVAQASLAIVRKFGLLHDAAKTNPALADAADQLFQTTIAASVKDNAKEILDRDLDLPEYFHTQVNADGTLTITIDGLKLVARDQFGLLSGVSSAALDDAQAIDVAQQGAWRGHDTPEGVKNTISEAEKQAAKQRYQQNLVTVKKAEAGLNLTANLLAFLDPALSNEVRVVGGAAVTVADAFNTMAHTELDLLQGIMVAGNVTGAALAIYNLFGSSGPSADEQILEQLRELGIKLDRMRNEMHARFDIIDANLAALYDTIDTRFDRLDRNVQMLIQNLTKLQGDFNRFERNFYDLTTKGFVADLDNTITHGIGFSDTFGFDMTKEQFSDFENTFYAWATHNARTLATLPSVRTFDDATLYEELTKSIANEDSGLFSDAANINYLRLLPQKFNRPPLSVNDVVNPSVWAMAAQAHYVLAHENASHEARLNPSRIADIIAQGKAVQTLLNNIVAPDSQGRHPLFKALLDNYEAQLRPFELEKQKLERPFFDAHTFGIDPFKFSQLIPYEPPTQLGRCDGAGSPVLAMPNNVADTVMAMAGISISLRLGLGAVSFCYDAQMKAQGGLFSPVIILRIMYQDSTTPRTEYGRAEYCFCSRGVEGGDPYARLYQVWTGFGFGSTPPYVTGKVWFEQNAYSSILPAVDSFYGDLST